MAEQHVFSARAVHLLRLFGVARRCGDAGLLSAALSMRERRDFARPRGAGVVLGNHEDI